MNEPQTRIISITTALALVLALIIVAGFPLGYFLVKYYNLNEVLKARAEARAIFATQIISNNPDLWQFESIRLEHFLLQETDSGEPEEQRIIDLKGQIVAQTFRSLTSPVHTISYPLYESGRLVAYLEISRSLRPLFVATLTWGAVSLLLGAAVFLTLKSYPLRALSQTLTLLNKERQRFQVIFQSRMMAVAVLDRDCTILDANPTFLNLTLLSKEELRDHNFMDLELSEGREGMGPLFQELLGRQRESFNLEMCYQRRDGVLRWGDLSVFALYEATKNTSFFAMFNDITERKQSEAALQDSYLKIKQALSGIVQALSCTIELKDPYTSGHQQRVAQLACAICEVMGLSPEHIERMRILGYLHDIGKLAVPAEILIKPGKLSEIELSIVKTHAQKGYEILNKLDFGWPIAQAVYQHHERLNGSGYPQGLTGSDINQEARILAVADVVEAMVSHRPHRAAMGIDEALEEISKNKGISYDREVVEACRKLFIEQGFRFEAVA
jgi:PAS domain S-box-containing protein/putative nucleotidyltransferase with HDIG domain